MITFFKKGTSLLLAVESTQALAANEIEKLIWLFDGAKPLKSSSVKGIYLGPRKEMITPWSTNAVEIAATRSLPPSRM
jgi:phosphoribosylformylglycinamidine synthase